MKRICRLLLVMAVAVLICLQPLQAQAKAGWTPEALPAATFDTVFGDSRFINPEWLTKKVTISYGDKVWVTGMDAFAGIPVRLTNADGRILCSFRDTSVFSAFFAAINADLTAMTSQPIPAAFDNGAGSYVRQNGTMHCEATSRMAGWLASMLSNLMYTGACQDITQAIDPFLVPVTNAESLSMSPDYVLAGTYTTSFQTSSADRSTNIRVAASRLNNLVIMPGQEISVSDTFLPRTKANGYKPAGVYLNGVHTTGMGGGVCQVSSTTYAAVMNAGLTVTQRYPHSMPVSYLPKGMDAAIAAGSKDLKFRNDYSVPVVLQTSIKDKMLTVNVFVWEQALAGRSYKLWSKQTSSLSADTYLTAYLNGQEVSTRFVGTSKYKPLKESGE